jgi:hypothetical protein
VNTRQKLELKMTFREILTIMSEGNPGAINVLLKLLMAPDGIKYVLDLDDMGMRGWQIWVAWRDFCREDLGTLIASLEDRNPRMVEFVNASKGGPPDTPRAVTSGGSIR